MREARNMQAEPLLIAEVVTTALMIEGSALIPASWKAMTNGDCWAVPVDVCSFAKL